MPWIALGIASTGNVNPENENPRIVNRAAMLRAILNTGTSPTIVTATASQAMMKTNISRIIFPTLPATGNLHTPYIRRSSNSPIRRYKTV